MLQLVAGVVAHYGRGLLVARQVDGACAVTDGPVQGVEDLRAVLGQPAQQPGKRSLGFRLSANAEEGFDGIPGIAYPCEPIVIVLGAADALWQ